MSLEIDLEILDKIEKKLDKLNSKADLLIERLQIIQSYECKENYIQRPQGEA